MADETPAYAPVEEQVFFDADRVFVSDYRLRFPYRAVSEDRVRFPIRTVEMFRIRSAAVHEATVASETGLNKFLKVMGGIIKWPAFLGAMVIFLILILNILILVSRHYGYSEPGIPQGETPVFIEALAETFEAFPVRFSLVIGGLIVSLGVLAWLGDKIMNWNPVKREKYRVGVDVVARRGETERLYFGEYEEPNEAQRIVSAIEHAKVAIMGRGRP